MFWILEVIWMGRWYSKRDIVGSRIVLRSFGEDEVVRGRRRTNIYKERNWESSFVEIGGVSKGKMFLIEFDFDRWEVIFFCELSLNRSFLVILVRVILKEY